MKRIDKLRDKIWGEKKGLKLFVKGGAEVEMTDMNNSKSFISIPISKGGGHEGHHGDLLDSRKITSENSGLGHLNLGQFPPFSIKRFKKEREEDKEVLIRRSDSIDSQENSNRQYKILPLSPPKLLPSEGPLNVSGEETGDRVYKETTEEFQGDTDEMNRCREEMSEVQPLRGDEEWSSTGQGGRRGLFQTHHRTLLWALFLGAMALSVLIFFAILAVVLEMKSSKVPALSTTPDEIEQGSQVDLSSTTFLPPSISTHPPLASTARDYQKLIKRSWPLEDMMTKDEKQFKSKYLVTPQPHENSVQSTSTPSDAVLNDKIADEKVIMEGLKAATQAKIDREQTEARLIKLGFLIKSMTPFGRFALAARKMTEEARRRGATGYFIDKASQKIAQELNMTKVEAQQGIIWDVTGSLTDYLPNEFCTSVQDTCNRSAIYRSYDGSCNNLHHSTWGASNEAYRRVLLPDYADGISQPRVASDGKSPLPNPRLLSTTIIKSDPTEDPVASLMLVLWGQFLDHDIAYTTPSTGFNGTAIACCSEGQILGIQHPECYPFTMSAQDEFYSTVGQQCTNFVRSAPSPICHLGPREQFNQITSFLDASTLYGSSDAELAQVLGRFPTANPGRLPLLWIEDGRPLPMRSTDLDDSCQVPEEVEKKKLCFKSGDKRINEYIGTTTINLVWSRQHNEIAEHLVAANPHWLDREKIFQESRRIVIAQIQHITYNEFLPRLLGPSLIKAAGLQLNSTGYYNGYDDTVNPTISNTFAGAAFRVGHSMIQGLLKMIGPRWKNEDFVQIHKLFFNPFPLYDLGKMDAILRGHMDRPAGKADLHFSKQVTDHLFELRNNTYGLDLAAIDIQRGRDHGLQGYIFWRQACGLSEVKDFSDLTGIWSLESVQSVQKMYTSVEDIDLYIGGLAETPIQGAMVGPVFACLLVDQFNRLRKGDRFWYEGNIQLKPFTLAQLQMIRKTTLAHILCANSDGLETVQIRAMERESPTNPRVDCARIPGVAYHPWKEEPTPASKLLLKQSSPINGTDSLEELYTEDEEEERFEKEKDKDNHFKLNNSTNLVKPTSDKEESDILFNNSSMRKQSSKSKIILEYPTLSPISSSTAKNTMSQSENLDKNEKSQQGHKEKPSDLEFHQSKDGIILEWRSRRNSDISKSDINSIPQEYEDYFK